MSPSGSPYRLLYENKKFHAIDFTSGGREELAEAQADLRESGVLLRVQPAMRMIQKCLDQVQSDVYELFLVREQGGIRTREGGSISVASQEQLRALFGEGGNYSEDGSARQMLEIVQQILSRIGRVVVTSPDQVVSEIDEWRGGYDDTLFYDEKLLQSGPVTPKERLIVEQLVIPDLVEEEYFRPRTDPQINKLLESHLCLRVKGGPLGGVSVQPWEKGNYELAGLWTGHPGNGIGCNLVELAKRAFIKENGKALVAITAPNVGNLFTKSGFTSLGSTDEIAGKTDIPELNRYPKGRHREAFVFSQ